MCWKVQLKLSPSASVSLCCLGRLLGGLVILGVDHCLFHLSFVLEQVNLYLFCQQGVSLWENFGRMYYCMPFPHVGNFDASM